MLNQAFRRIRCLCVRITVACLQFVASANAATITVDERFYSVQLEGAIVSGDYEKLRSVAEELSFNIRDNPNQGFPVVLHLYSPGGDVAEAIKIGRLVRALRWVTDAPVDSSSDRKYFERRLKNIESDYMCASACFFIYVAGVDRVGGYRSYIAPLILGIHRPYLTDKELRALNSKSALNAAINIRSSIELYFKEMGVPAKYVDVMFSIPKDEIKWLSVDDISELRGFIPELRDWVDARCDTRTEIERSLDKRLEAKLKSGPLSRDDSELFDMLEKKDMERGECEQNVRIELDKQGIIEVFK